MCSRRVSSSCSTYYCRNIRVKLKGCRHYEMILVWFVNLGLCTSKYDNKSVNRYIMMHKCTRKTSMSVWMSIGDTIFVYDCLRLRRIQIGRNLRQVRELHTNEVLGGARRNEQICDLKTKRVLKQQDVWSKWVDYHKITQSRKEFAIIEWAGIQNRIKKECRLK